MNDNPGTLILAATALALAASYIASWIRERTSRRNRW